MSRSRESRPRGSRKLQTKITTLTRRHVFWYDAVRYARALITSCYGVGNQEAYSVNNLLNSRFTFRLWHILVFLLVMTIIITVTRILAARFCPASRCYKISGKEHEGNQWCIPATKKGRGNLIFLPLQPLAFSAPMLRSSRLLNLRKGCIVQAITFLILRAN